MSRPRLHIPPVACQHIADYYQYMWEKQPCIGYNMLRHGYSQCAEGIISYHNNLFGEQNIPA